jgi:hypothetical protein
MKKAVVEKVKLKINLQVSMALQRACAYLELVYSLQKMVVSSFQEDTALEELPMLSTPFQLLDLKTSFFEERGGLCLTSSVQNELL